MRRQKRNPAQDTRYETVWFLLSFVKPNPLPKYGHFILGFIGDWVIRPLFIPNPERFGAGRTYPFTFVNMFASVAE